jgi:hypothetical protein
LWFSSSWFDLVGHSVVTTIYTILNQQLSWSERKNKSQHMWKPS